MIKKLLAGILFVVFVVTSNVVYSAEVVGIAGKCLDVKGGGSADRTPIILYPCHGKANQRWVIR